VCFSDVFWYFFLCQQLRAYHRISSELYESGSVTSLAQLQEWLQDDEDERSSYHVLVALSWSEPRAQFDIVGGVEVLFLVRSNTAVVKHWFLARPGKSHNRRHECKRVLLRLGEEMRAQVPRTKRKEKRKKTHPKQNRRVLTVILLVWTGCFWRLLSETATCWTWQQITCCWRNWDFARCLKERRNLKV
jgi:hypothetical protein